MWSFKNMLKNMLKNIECCRLLVSLGKYQSVELDKNSLSLLGLDFSVFRWLFICALSSRSCEKGKKWVKKIFNKEIEFHLFLVLICPSLRIPRCHFRPLSFLRSRATAMENKILEFLGKYRVFPKSFGTHSNTGRKTSSARKLKTWGVQATLKLQILGKQFWT